MNVEDRIEQVSGCAIIALTEPEKNHYLGCGWKLALFVEGHLVGFFDPGEVKYQKSVQAMANEAIEKVAAWAANTKGEVWLAMCSCYHLCDPQLITLNDAYGLPKMTRIFTNQPAG